MKRFALLLCGLSLAMGACKKTDSGNGSSGGSFTLGNQTFNVTSAVRVTAGNVIWYTFNSFNNQTLASSSINFYFPGTTDPASGSYTIVPSSAGMSSGQVNILGVKSDGSGNAPTEYTPIGGESVSFTNSGGKVSIKITAANTKVSIGGSTNVSADVWEVLN
ncbi:MAG: hypothetical protein JST36_00830 [Bacteroidetes bacterium]|nr:hypothetical protein [Bacteroidota bacterium]